MNKTALGLLFFLCAFTLSSCIHAPDRYGLIFASENEQKSTGDLYRIPDVTQNKIEQLTFTPDVEEGGPLVLNNGNQIVFPAFDPSPLSDKIYLLDIENKNLKDITDEFGPLTYPTAWSPVQKQFAVISDKEGYLSIVNFDGSKKWNIPLTSIDTSWPGVDSVDWSPDGKELAFSRNTCLQCFNSPLEIASFVINLASGELSQITNYSSDCDWPRWSPSGEQIAVMCNIYPGPSNVRVYNKIEDIHFVSADGFPDLSYCLYPAWSPTGKQLVLMCHNRNDLNGNRELYVINSNGSGLRQINLTDDASRIYLVDPIWSPDGKQIIYVAGSDAHHANIFVVDLDGSNNRRLTSQDGPYGSLFAYPLP